MFDNYSNICDLKKNGWGLFRPESYDIKLMEYVDGEPKVAGDDVSWDKCDELNDNN